MNSCLRRGALATALFILLGAARPGHPVDSLLLLISIDGMRHDYPARAGAPAFRNLAREGVRAGRLIPPFPASTLPSHATLATGCYPERHGILNSRFLDHDRGEFDRSEDPGWLGCEPVWIAAEKQGIRSAVLNWIGSYGPWRGVEASWHETGFQSMTDRESMRRIVRWLSMPVSDRPRLIMAYLSGVDHAGHEHGPDSQEVIERVRSVDRALGLLQADIEKRGLSNRLNLMIVTDHGMVPVLGRIDPGSALARTRLKHRLLASGGSANAYFERRSEVAKASAVLSRIPHLEVFSSDSLPRELHYGFPGRTGDLVLLASPGFELGPERESGWVEAKGIHGFRGSEPSMAGIFYARGPAFLAGSEIDRIDAVDVAELACAVLGIRAPRDSQGRIPRGILRSGTP